MEVLIPFVLLAAFAVFIGVIQSNRARGIINLWTAENGYRLIEANYSFFKGPFFWTSTKDQWVYRITVQDENGDIRTGWLRCGSWFWGILSSKADVRWDGE